jgi:hypothetical protein
MHTRVVIRHLFDIQTTFVDFRRVLDESANEVAVSITDWIQQMQLEGKLSHEHL